MPLFGKSMKEAHKKAEKFVETERKKAKTEAPIGAVDTAKKQDDKSFEAAGGDLKPGEKIQTGSGDKKPEEKTEDPIGAVDTAKKQDDKTFEAAGGDPKPGEKIQTGSGDKKPEEKNIQFGGGGDVGSKPLKSSKTAKEDPPKEPKGKSRKSQVSFSDKRDKLKTPEETTDTEVEEDEETPCFHFPCCCGIPLDIAMIGFALIDILYYTFYALSWAIFLAVEPFAGKDRDLLLQNNKGNGSNPGLDDHSRHLGENVAFRQRLLKYGTVLLDKLLTDAKEKQRQRNEDQYEDEVPDFGEFWETTTTNSPLGTLEPATYAETYSRIAHRFKHFDQEVRDACGQGYYASFLWANELTVTRNLFEEIAFKAIFASLLFVFIGAILLTLICCFRGYIFSKLMIIILWYMQLIPCYLILRAAIMSQSLRFCILEHGMGKWMKGQQILFWTLLWPIINYKLYEMFIWANYFLRFFKNNKEGKLINESYFSAQKTEERQNRLYMNNPYGKHDNINHHRRTVGMSRLFRHYKPDHDEDTDKSNVPTPKVFTDIVHTSDDSD